MDKLFFEDCNNKEGKAVEHPSLLLKIISKLLFQPFSFQL